jgi:hypothetical protein
VVDLRPFHPDHDLPRGGSRDGWIAHAKEPGAQVEWGGDASRQILSPRSGLPGLPSYRPEELRELVEGLVALDPRPGHLRGGTGDWAMRILDFDVKFRMDGGKATILAVV